MKINFFNHIGDKVNINGMEYFFDILTDSIGEHPIWDSNTYRIFAGFEDSHFMIDIDDEEGYNIISTEFIKTFESFDEYRECVIKTCSKMLDRYRKDNV